jgi:hypothetical protein
MLAHGGDGLGVDHDTHAEGLGDCVGGDVVMGGPDAARSEDISEPRAELVHRGDDLGLQIGHDPHLAQGDANSRQIAGDVENIFVLGAPRQDLLADDHERGSDGIPGRFWHMSALAIPT